MDPLTIADNRDTGTLAALPNNEHWFLGATVIYLPRKGEQCVYSVQNKLKIN
jgi:hypothetical protein